jgi:hypothetical protein
MTPKIIGDLLSAFNIQVTAIAVIQSFLLSLSGFLNALAYAVNPTVLKAYRRGNTIGTSSQQNSARELKDPANISSTEASPLLLPIIN